MGKDQRSPRPSGQRPLRVGEELRHALADILARGDIRDPDVAGTPITVTEVRVSPDLRNATAFVLPLGGQHAPEVLAGLTRCAPYLRSQLARAVRLKFVPTIGFKLDTSFDRASQIEEVLRRPEVAVDLQPDPDTPDDIAKDPHGE